MLSVVEKHLHVEFHRGHHLHCMVAQIPNQMESTHGMSRLIDPQEKWRQILSIFELIADGPGNLKKCHFLVLPEFAMPADRVEDALQFIGQHFRPNTVTMFGIEHINLIGYLQILERYAEDNFETLASVRKDLDSGDIAEIPVNWIITAVKESDGRLRVFLQAKSHPFVGEESLDSHHDLYRGKIAPLFRCHPACFNFMSIVCIDYIYRDLYQSNINIIIEKANEIFFQTRQRLDLLVVLECNPKPEHPAFQDVVNGFYGEYLSFTPGVRDSITIFCNTSRATSGMEGAGLSSFGKSSVIMHRNHRFEPVKYTEFVIDDFNGIPVCRLRFGSQTRLFYFNLPLFQELDPRTTRVPLKIHGIYRPAGDSWQSIDEDTAG